MANFRLTELVHTIENYNTESRSASAVSSEILKLQQLNKNVTIQPVVQYLQRKLTPYAFKLVLDQMYQVSCYKRVVYDELSQADPLLADRPDSEYRLDDVDPQKGQIGVVRFGECQKRSLIYDTVGLDEHNLPKSTMAAFDDGNDEGDGRCTYSGEYAMRIVEFDYAREHVSCTCLFCQAYGGLPCRHILTYCFLMGKDKYPMGAISPKWRALTEFEVTQLRHDMIQARDYRPVLPQRTSAAHKMSKADRYRTLMAAYRQCAQMSLELQDEFETSLAQCEDRMAEIKLNLEEAKKASATRATQAAQPTAPQVAGLEQDREPDQPADRGDCGSAHSALGNGAQPPKKRIQKQEAEFRALYGVAYEPSPLPFTREQLADIEYCKSELKNVIILYKYPEARRQSSWWIATIVDSKANESGDHDFTLHFSEDDQTETHKLLYSKYVAWGTANAGSWCCLIEAPLSNVDRDSTVESMPSSQGMGRPRTVRGKPAHERYKPASRPTAGGATSSQAKGTKRTSGASSACSSPALSPSAARTRRAR